MSYLKRSKQKSEQADEEYQVAKLAFQVYVKNSESANMAAIARILYKMEAETEQKYQDYILTLEQEQKAIKTEI